MSKMRCLNTETFELHSGTQEGFKVQGYAVLSHRWMEPEILCHQVGRYAQELRNTRGRHHVPQLDKILGACITARQKGISWMWIDSCCINKRESSELAESINSMYKWYTEAVICLTHFADVRRDANMATAGPRMFYDSRTGKPSVWFTRGWTLQELLAPKNMLFYDANWQLMGSKKNLAPELEKITGIESKYLTGAEDFRTACIAAKMSWMAGRETFREEDMAYSMLGIFHINMNVQYGEGKGAFMRMQELLLTKNDESLFAWKMPLDGPGAAYKIKPDSAVDLGPDEWGLLAPSPKWYQHCGKMSTQSKKKVMRHRGGFTRTPQGISGPISKKDHYVTAVVSGMTIVGVIPFQIWLAVRERTTLKYTLNCWEPNESGSLKAVRVHLRPVIRDQRIFIRTSSQHYDLVSSVENVNYSTIGTVWQPEMF